MVGWLDIWLDRGMNGWLVRYKDGWRDEWLVG